MNHLFFYTIAAGWQAKPEYGYTGVWLRSGTITVSSAWVMENTQVSSGLTQYAFNGGITRSAVITPAGIMSVSSGGRAIAPLCAGGSIWVYSSGVASDVTQSDGTVVIAVGGAIVNAVKYSGAFTVGNGGYGQNLAISGGGFAVSAGGSAENVTIQIPSGYIPTISGHATNLTYYNTPGSRLEIRGASALVSELTLRGGIIWCYSQGAIQTGAISGGNLYVFNSGSAYDLTISSGNVSVYTGGALSGAVVSNSGTLVVSSLGLATDPVVSSGGKLTIYNGGTGVSAVSDTGAVVYISSGGLASGGIFVGSTVVFAAGKLSSATLCNAAAVGNGGSAIDVTAGGSLGTGLPIIIISAGAHVSNLLVTSATGGARGNVRIYTSDVVGLTISNTGNVNIYSNGVARNILQDVGGSLTVVQYGSALNLIQVSGAGRIATDPNTLISGASLGGTVGARGYLYDITLVGPAGYLTLSAGTATNVIVESAATLLISSGASAVGVISQTSAVITVRAGGYIEYA